MEAAVGEEKQRILEQREEMEKTADEIREGFREREALLEVRLQRGSPPLHPLWFRNIFAIGEEIS